MENKDNVRYMSNSESNKVTREAIDIAMLDLLEKSYASDPSNEHSGDISLMIEQTQKMKKMYGGD